VSSTPFAVLGVGDTFKTDAGGQKATLISSPSAQDVKIAYSPSDNSYFITLPGFQQGMLGETAYNGTNGRIATSSTSKVLELAFGFSQPVFVILPVPGSDLSPYSYTSFGSWSGQTGTNAAGEVLRAEGIFAYGIPTAASEVPITGSANYAAQIQGNVSPGFDFPLIIGPASLTFDFGAGKLSGWMHPLISVFPGSNTDLGLFDFTQTVYSTGSTTFSGKFVVPGLPNAESSFQGNFTGPNAAELMARFQTQFQLNGDQGAISGVWIGKKQ